MTQFDISTFKTTYLFILLPVSLNHMHYFSERFCPIECSVIKKLNQMILMILQDTLKSAVVEFYTFRKYPYNIPH